jgi:hypothetical protein
MTFVTNVRGSHIGVGYSKSLKKRLLQQYTENNNINNNDNVAVVQTEHDAAMSALDDFVDIFVSTPMCKQGDTAHICWTTDNRLVVALDERVSSSATELHDVWRAPATQSHKMTTASCRTMRCDATLRHTR